MLKGDILVLLTLGCVYIHIYIYMYAYGTPHGSTFVCISGKMIEALNPLLMEFPNTVIIKSLLHMDLQVGIYLKLVLRNSFPGVLQGESRCEP